MWHWSSTSGNAHEIENQRKLEGLKLKSDLTFFAVKIRKLSKLSASSFTILLHNISHNIELWRIAVLRNEKTCSHRFEATNCRLKCTVYRHMTSMSICNSIGFFLTIKRRFESGFRCDMRTCLDVGSSKTSRRVKIKIENSRKTIIHLWV